VTGASPLVSLIMPVWSPRIEWLRAAVESALAQTGCAIELVVVDDGCEVPVADVLSDIVDERMRIERVSHGRVSRARNAGIEVARGSWIRFVDYDDVIVEDSTSHLLALGEGDDRVITYGATAVCDDELRPLSVVSSELQGRVARACLLGRFETTIHSLLFSRRVVDEIGPWEPAIVVSQDWDYALRGFEVAKVRGDQRIATYYRTHSTMNSRDVRQGVNGYRLVVERYFERHPDERASALERRAKAGFHLFAAVQSATRLREQGAALRHFGRALALDPITSLMGLGRYGTLPLRPGRSRLRTLFRRSVTR
jgi:glycosyltransferase involved in cell wall biosynthesis